MKQKNVVTALAVTSEMTLHKKLAETIYAYSMSIHTDSDSFVLLSKELLNILCISNRSKRFAAQIRHVPIKSVGISTLNTPHSFSLRYLE